MPFAISERTDAAPKRVGESDFTFLDRSARPEIERVRAFLSGAIDRYPASERDELIARLRSGNETHFRSASFEVLLHEALLRLGYRLTPHPDPGTGASTRPDFLVTDPEGREFFLEAVLASERDGRNPAAEAMKQLVLGQLDEAPHAAFTLDVDSEGDPHTQPSGRALTRQTHAWLGTLEPDALRERLITDGLDAMPTFTWSHENWELTLRAIPLSVERRGRSTRLVGSFGAGARWVNTWEPLRDAVKKKANRYGGLTVPFVVAVNSSVFHLDEIDEVQALFGEEYWVENLHDPERSGPRRRENGAWRGPHGPQNRRVSAVWFFNDLTPYSLAARRPTLYVNPWANTELPASLLRIRTKQLQDDELVEHSGLELRSIFDLPAEWPE